MNFALKQQAFLVSKGGLFDFDLTFLAEGFLFLLLSLVVTFVFIAPISKQMKERAESINYDLRKSSILISLGYEKLSKCIELLTSELNELNRQLKLVRSHTNELFEVEINFVQKENLKILTKLKGNLASKSAILLSTINNDLNQLTDTFFVKRFKSIS
jgi:F0F1-type ATP synthase membrane subunit b/b'